MSRRSWLLTTGLGVLTLLLAGAAVLGQVRLSDARGREEAAQEELAAIEAGLVAAREDLEVEETRLVEAETELAAARAYFTPEAVMAVTQVQTQLTEAACEQARTAVRDGADPPTADQLIVLAVAGGQGGEADAGLDVQWGLMLEASPIQERLDACAADERAEIEAERQAEAARRAAEERERASETGYFGGCNETYFIEGYCPSEAEIAAERLAERLCGGGRYEEAAREGIDCGVP